MQEISILVVEDELIISYYLQRVLKDEGFNAYGAKTASEAIEKAEKMHPSLIIMDIYLKGSNMDGVQIAEAIKKKHNIPIIYLTSYTDQATRERMELTRPKGIFIKPVKEKELLGFIEQLFSNQIREEDLI